MQAARIFSFCLLILTINSHETNTYGTISKEERLKAFGEKHQLFWTTHCDSGRMREPRTRAAAWMGPGGGSKPGAVNYKMNLTMTPQATGPGPGFLHIFSCSALFLEGPEHYTTSLCFPTKIFDPEFPPVSMKRLISYYTISFPQVSRRSHHNSLPFQHSSLKPVPL